MRVPRGHSGPGAEGLLGRNPATAKTSRKMVGEFSDFALGHSQHLGDFDKRAPGLKSGKAADYGAMFPSVFLEDKFDHVVFKVMGEIDVNVGQYVHCHPVLVQKTSRNPKIDIKADGANSADAKAVADQRVRGAAACNPFNSAPPAFLEKIPSDEKIFLVADLIDDAQFLHRLWAELGGPRAVTPLQAFQHQPVKILA